MKLLDRLKNETFISLLIATGMITVAVSIVFFSWNEFNFNTSEKVNAEKLAQFGDFIGGLVGSIWALAGVFLFYKALVEQRSDFRANKEALELQVQALNQQIEEFKLGRKEQTLSRRVYEEQSRTSKKQQFDSSFYSLLGVYSCIKNDLQTKQGLSFFNSLAEELCLVKHVDSETYIYNQEKCIQKFNEIYEINRDDLSRYYRAFYRLVSVIDNSDLLANEKFFYSKILRAQLSDFEIIALFYNSLTIIGEKTQKYALKYNLFKHIPYLYLPSLRQYQNNTNNQELSYFINLIRRFLVKHIPHFYDVNLSDVSKVEEENSELNIILGIYFTDNIDIRVYCRKGHEKKKFGLSEDEFSHFTQALFCEILISMTYMQNKDIEIVRSLTTYDTKQAFCITVKTTELIRLPEDVL